MDLGALLDTCNWCDKWKFSTNLFRSNIWLNSAPLQDITLPNLSEPDFDLSGSRKVLCDDVIGLSMYAFLLMFNSNLWPNAAPLQDIKLRNLGDREFDLSMSLKVKCDVIGLANMVSY